jgi:hypothetical protein
MQLLASSHNPVTIDKPHPYRTPHDNFLNKP